MKAKILIGKMAKLHNISTQTLRYYDKIGLLKPAYIEEDNNYRYYDIEQSAHLDSILFLKSLGMSLENIKEYFDNRNLNYMISMLREKEDDIEKEIELLKLRKRSIKSKIDLIEKYNKENVFDKCEIKTTFLRQIIYLPFEQNGSVLDFEYNLKELDSLVGDQLSSFNSMITCIVGMEDLLKGNYNQYKYIGLLFHQDILNSNLKAIPKGKYATIVYKGSYDKGEVYYDKLLQFIKNEGLEVIGDSLLITITDATFTAFEKEYINEIQIPVI